MSEEPRGLRIGEVAERTGTTPRTIRYYEEIGLLPAAHERAPGSHRLYDEADVLRLEEVLRLKQLLGVSLDELSELVAAETARAELRSEWHSHEASPPDSARSSRRRSASSTASSSWSPAAGARSRGWRRSSRRSAGSSGPAWRSWSGSPPPRADAPPHPRGRGRLITPTDDVAAGRELRWRW